MKRSSPRPRKNQTFNLRLSALDRERLDILAQHHNAPAATTVRMLVKRFYDEISAPDPERTGTGHSCEGGRS